MLLGILSDTHDDLTITRRAVEMLQAEGAEALVHCGDLSRAPIVSACSVLPFSFALGNHDADNVPELRQVAVETGARCLGWGGIVELCGKRIGVAHGHMTTDLHEVLAQNPQYLLSGHAHYPFDFCDGAVRRINPGALFRAEEFTVAILNLETDELRFIRVS